MSSTLLYNPINPSIALLSRSHFPVLVCRDFPTEICRSVTHKSALVRRFTRVRATTAEALKVGQSEGDGNSKSQDKNLRILVAGSGIGGLVFALAAKKKGFDVVVFERDLSAISGKGRHRGDPIQNQSNALAALEAIDMDVAEEIMEAGCITGDRINGLVDGESRIEDEADDYEMVGSVDNDGERVSRSSSVGPSNGPKASEKLVIYIQ